MNIGTRKKPVYSWQAGLAKFVFDMDTKKNEIIIKSPEKLCLYSNCDDTLLFFKVLAGLVHNYKRYVVIDMAECSYISAAAALVFFSEVSKCRSMSDLPDANRVVTIRKSNDSDLMDLLKVTTLWDVIRTGAQRRIDDLGDDDHIYISVREMIRLMISKSFSNNLKEN